MCDVFFGKDKEVVRSDSNKREKEDKSSQRRFPGYLLLDWGFGVVKKKI